VGTERVSTDTRDTQPPLYAHQAECVARMAGRSAFALLMSMRTGKSRCVIEDWQRTHDLRRGGALLVVAPAGSYRGWERELDQFLDPEIRERALVATWDSRRGPASIARLFDARSCSCPRVLLVNVEAYSTVDAVRQASAALLQSHAESVMVVDESTTLANYYNTGKGSLRAQTMHLLRPMAAQARILTGLPTPKSPLDLWGQFSWLDPTILGFVSYQAFEDRYAIIKRLRVGGRHAIRIPVEFRPVIEELWATKLAPWSYRKRLEECADIPEKAYVTRMVGLTPEQERLYREMEATATAQLEPGVFMSAQQRIVLLLRLHQLCCGWATSEDGTVFAVPELRTRALLDLLQDYDGKAIVWCSWAHDLQKVAAALTQAFGVGSTTVFWGGNRGDREAQSDRFKTDPACRFLVATPGAGGRGRDWSEAGLIVYFSSTNNLEHRDQSEERASSVRKRDLVTVVDFQTEGTVEGEIIQAMRRKMDWASITLGDPRRSWVV
jgi:SNF2 family DNA or RNA helicase